jgi:hypothetical protein
VEDPAERAQAAETDIEANVRYAPIAGSQEKHRPLDAPSLKIAVRGFPESRAEGADEVRLRRPRNPREAWNGKRFRKRAIHRIPCAQHPSIAFFHRSAHHAYFITEAVIFFTTKPVSFQQSALRSLNLLRRADQRWNIRRLQG